MGSLFLTLNGYRATKVWKLTIGLLGAVVGCVNLLYHKCVKRVFVRIGCVFSFAVGTSCLKLSLVTQIWERMIRFIIGVLTLRCIYVESVYDSCLDYLLTYSKVHLN